ncbi:MAG: TonB-dependent receptor, partial [Bacteroidales bacterium]|nr:TonB-dependent receptor [Bacteroidales bacterium]
MNKTLKMLLSVMSAMLFVVSAYAQVTTANIAGRVADAQGPVAGAVVTATHTATGTQYYSVVDKNGQYRINNVLPGGPYTIKTESLGYRTSEVNNFYTAIGETGVVDFVLEDESISLDAVVVSADASDSGMNIRRSGAGTTVSQRTMSNLPSVNRSLNDVMSLTPQASSTTNGLAIGGGTYRGSTVTVDGAAFNNAFGIGSNLPAGGSPISLDAIEQISVNITPFDVRQSGFQGGAINAVTKSGTNQFSASAYNYYTSEKLRGDKIGEASVTNTEALSNTTGFTVGGPIIKN